MLHREHLGTPIGNGRRQTRIRHSGGRDGDIDRLRQIHPTEHDARVGLRWAQRQLHALTAVKTNTHRFGEGLKGSLFKHSEILVNLPLRGDSLTQSR